MTSHPVVSIRVAPRAVRRLFLGAPWVLSVLGLAFELAGEATDDGELFGWVRIFSLSHEGNLPTLYQGAVLAACAAMLALVGRAKTSKGDRWHRHWSWLSAGFLFMALDEWTSFHELLNPWFDLRGVLLFAWILPYGLAAAAAGLAFVPFLRALPRPVAARFLLAGLIFLGGAIGMELPLGWWTDRHGIDNLGYSLLDWLEETLELIGAGWFAATVFEQFRRAASEVSLLVSPM